MHQRLGWPRSTRMCHKYFDCCSTSARAVKRFQRLAGLSCWTEFRGPRRARRSDATASTFLGTRPLKQGAAGWDVAELQFLLAWHGFPSATFDGEPRPAHRARPPSTFSAGRVSGPTASPARPRLAALRTGARLVPDLARLAGRGPVGDGYGPRGDRFHAGVDIVAASRRARGRRRARPRDLRRLRPRAAGGTSSSSSHRQRRARRFYAHLSKISAPPRRAGRRRTPASAW